MKKMLFLAVVVMGGGYYLRNNLTITPDAQVRLSRWAVPIPGSVQNSPVYGMVIMAARMQTAPQAAADPAHPRAAAAGDPRYARVPIVTSAASTYNPNSTTGAPAGSVDQFSAVAKALRGQ